MTEILSFPIRKELDTRLAHLYPLWSLLLTLISNQALHIFPIVISPIISNPILLST